jgi:hypothetical protein
MKRQYDFSRGKRGAVVPTPPGKTRITIRIDDDVLEWFRKKVHEAGGGNYQTMINQALREHVEGHVAPLEETLRRVLQDLMPPSALRSGKRSLKKTPRRQR